MAFSNFFKKISDQKDDPNFFTKNIKEIGMKRDKMSDCYSEAITCQDFDLKIALLQKTLDLYEDFRSFCYQNGGKNYFYEIYEHSWNSNTNQFDSRKEMILKDLDHALFVRNTVVPKILELSSNGGIMQKDIYNHFCDLEKKEIQKIIAEMDCEKLIRKEKSGNSYIIKS